MKRIVCLLCALCLLFSLAGCGAERITGAAEETPYSLVWETQRDGSILLTFDADVPEGYSWQGSGNGVVKVTAAAKQAEGGTSFKVEGEEIGEQTVSFTLEESSGVLILYTFAVDFAVDSQRVLSLADCRGYESGETTTIGSGSCAITAIAGESALQLILVGNDWQVSHENDAFLMNRAEIAEGTVLTLYRQDARTHEGELYEAYLQEAEGNTTAETEEAEQPTVQTYPLPEGAYYEDVTGLYIDPATGLYFDANAGLYMDPNTGIYIDPVSREPVYADSTDTAVDTAADMTDTAEITDVGETDTDPFYQPKTDTMTLESCGAGMSYTLTLYMDESGKITVADYTTGSYTGEATYGDKKIVYDSVSGEAHIYSEEYAGWDRELEAEKAAQKQKEIDEATEPAVEYYYNETTGLYEPIVPTGTTQEVQ